ncbi:MAG: dTDP-4-dehydrorhamnose 3,5-epimerase family protein [Steroidobacteraceae bacterium]
MKLHATPIPGVHVLELEPLRDERGYFARQWCSDELARGGLTAQIVQINTAHNPRSGTLRGMHLQRAPHAEVKIVNCTRGAIYDVALDLRRDSPTHCQWFGIELTADNGRALYIPEGCAHGALSLCDDSAFTYLTSHRFERHSAYGVRYDDPAFAIQWPRPVEIVSAADRGWPDYERELAAP